MTQENKELLLRDLSARLTYGVKVTWDGKYPITLTPSIYVALWKEERDQNIPKVYLRPMSSMTEEEIKECKHLVAFCGSPTGSSKFVDWLNAHHFDFRLTSEELSMIEAGLALEAPEGMYEIQN